ncbi:MAG: MFS transporter, partial [Chloroflexi bacterium]|nr:MFS transporter [Chloroflexota bacterium]
MLFKAIEDECGWARALISGVASFGRFGGAMLGPVEGFLTDRFGSGKMVLVGFTMGGVGLIAFSMIQGALQYYFAFFLLSLGFSVCWFVPSITAVKAWLFRNRA